MLRNRAQTYSKPKSGVGGLTNGDKRMKSGALNPMHSRTRTMKAFCATGAPDSFVSPHSSGQCPILNHGGSQRMHGGSVPLCECLRVPLWFHARASNQDTTFVCLPLPFPDLLRPLGGEDVGEHSVLLIGSKLRPRRHLADDARPLSCVSRHGIGCVAGGALCEVDAASRRERGYITAGVRSERGRDRRCERFQAHAAGGQESGGEEQRLAEQAPLFATGWPA